MKNVVDRHCRIYDLSKGKFVLNFYVFEGEPVMTSLLSAMKQFKIDPVGEFRVDWMVCHEDRLVWQEGSVIVLRG
jgi:hypothetical protein